MSEGVKATILIAVAAVLVVILLVAVGRGRDKCEDRGGNYEYSALTKMYKCEMP